MSYFKYVATALPFIFYFYLDGRLINWKRAGIIGICNKVITLEAHIHSAGMWKFIGST